MLRRTNRAPQGAVIRNAESNHETQRIARTVACSEQDWDRLLFASCVSNDHAESLGKVACPNPVPVSWRRLELLWFTLRIIVNTSDINRTSWDARVPVHLASAMYRRHLDALRAGGDALSPVVAEELGDVAGLRVAHLQCHIGTDSLALARRGASVVGVDFSQPAIDFARQLADELGLDATFVVSDVLEADRVLDVGGFDLVFATEGVHCWIPDMGRWFAVTAVLLKPGGRLYFHDGHPFGDLFEDDPASPDGIGIHYDYFSREPLRFGPGKTYAQDRDDIVVPATAEHFHSMAALINGVLDAGLRLDRITEHPACGWKKFSSMQPEGAAWQFANRLRGKVPMMLTIEATRADGSVSKTARS